MCLATHESRLNVNESEEIAHTTESEGIAHATESHGNTQCLSVMFQNFSKMQGNYVLLTQTPRGSHMSKIRFFALSIMEILINTFFLLY